MPPPDDSQSASRVKDDCMRESLIPPDSIRDALWRLGGALRDAEKRGDAFPNFGLIYGPAGSDKTEVARMLAHASERHTGLRSMHLRNRQPDA